MQLWFPSSLTETMSPRSEAAAKSVDPELEFDKEVYPIGISLAEVAIIGVHLFCHLVPMQSSLEWLIKTVRVFNETNIWLWIIMAVDTITITVRLAFAGK